MFRISITTNEMNDLFDRIERRQMDRKETIKTLQNIGAKLAEEYGYYNVIIGEDRQKGFWGEKFTEYLENVQKKLHGVRTVQKKNI